jgi:CheY-like chemotaxis protein
LNNLLSNAIKYTEKGYVKLSINHSILNDDRILLRFIVEDTGQGMRPEDVKKLFSEYLRFNVDVNKTTEGTGIGLNITKSLVELMEGTIEVGSTYGKGSSFMVEIKQKMAEHDIIGEDIAQQLCDFTFSGDKKYKNFRIHFEPMPYGKVLIVDDVEMNLFVAEGLLSPYGLNIEKAISGFEAIEKVENGQSYDIIFMDHMMPMMDGIETTKKLRALGYNGAIVALTANALVGNADLFRRNGFDDFISKPIDQRHLNVVLNMYIRDNHLKESGEK